MKSFKLLPLSSAVLAALCATNAFAENNGVAVLDTVTVTDNQGLKIKSNVVTTQTREESTQTDLRGLLKNEPSISLGGGNGTSQFLYIRGMGQNSIDVKVDNAYSDSQIHYHQGRHMLDPALVKVVSVQKGAGSASAGIGQTNGAVVAKTLDALELLKDSDKNFGAKVGVGVSTNHAHNYNAAVYGKGEIFDALISANRVNESNYEGGKGYVNKEKNASDRVPHSALDKTSYLAKLGATLGEHRFVLSHLNEQHEGERLVREEFPVNDVDFVYEADIDPATGKQKVNNGQPVWKRDKTTGELIKVYRLGTERQAPAKRKMSMSKTDLTWEGKNLGFAESASANVYRLIHQRWSADDKGNGYAGGARNTGATKTKVETLGANVNFDSELHENFLLKYGVNYRQQQAKPSKIFHEEVVKQTKRDVGLYAEGITSIHNVILTTGLRYDHFNFKAMDGKTRSDGSFNPSVGLVYEPIQYLSLSASHNYATRSPRMQDAIMAHGGRGIVSISNRAKAEQARNTEIGFNYNNGTFSVDGSYFWQHIKDALGTTTARNNHLCPAPTPKNKNECYSEIINAGTIKNRGYELNAGVQYNGFTTRIGVSHSKPRFYGDRLSTNPEYASAIGRTWTGSLSYRFEQPNVEIGVHHRIVESVKAADNFFKVGGTAPTSGKEGYNVTDITVNWKPFNNDKLNVNFAIDNVADKLYQAHGQRGAFPGRGREFRAGVNYTF